MQEETQNQNPVNQAQPDQAAIPPVPEAEVSGAAQLQLLTQNVDEIRVTLLATSQRVSAIEKSLGELLASHAVHDSRIAAIETMPAPPLPLVSAPDPSIEDEKENDMMNDEPVTDKEKADAEAYIRALGYTRENAVKQAEKIGHREVLRAQREGRNPLVSKK